jgi:hypothetical protein
MPGGGSGPAGHSSSSTGSRLRPSDSPAPATVVKEAKKKSAVDDWLDAYLQMAHEVRQLLHRKERMEKEAPDLAQIMSPTSDARNATASSVNPATAWMANLFKTEEKDRKKEKKITQRDADDRKPDIDVELGVFKTNERDYKRLVLFIQHLLRRLGDHLSYLMVFVHALRQNRSPEQVEEADVVSLEDIGPASKAKKRPLKIPMPDLPEHKAASPLSKYGEMYQTLSGVFDEASLSKTVKDDDEKQARFVSKSYRRALWRELQQDCSPEAVDRLVARAKHLLDSLQRRLRTTGGGMEGERTRSMWDAYEAASERALQRGTASFREQSTKVATSGGGGKRQPQGGPSAEHMSEEEQVKRDLAILASGDKIMVCAREEPPPARPPPNFFSRKEPLKMYI